MPTETTHADTSHDASAAVVRVQREVGDVLGRIAADPAGGTDALAEAIHAAGRVFVHGAGRSGLALRMTAMRLMHLGLTVHVVGDATTPAIGEGDLLLTASGSGTTGGVVRAARAAHEAGASVAALTTDPDSTLAALADTVVRVPAAQKLDRSGAHSVQYAGSLFEQAVVLIGDAAFDALWRDSRRDGDELWTRHANLE